MYAAYVSHDTVVNLLLEARAEANKGTPEGVTPLMVAAGCGNESICYFLLQVNGGRGRSENCFHGTGSCIHVSQQYCYMYIHVYTCKMSNVP